MKVLPVFAYVRCSTEEQSVSGLGLEAQREAIRTWCKLRGLSPAEVYEDPGESGAAPLGNRPGGKQLLERIDAGACIVIVNRLDRMFRNSADATAKIQEWTKSGVMLSSIDQSFDMTTATGRMMARLLTVLAEWERELIGERTSQAMAVKRDRGERITRDAPYGTRFVPSGRVNGKGEPIMIEAPDAEELAVIRLAREMRRRKVSLRSIAKELDRLGHKPRRGARWSHTTVKDILDDNRSRRLPVADALEPDETTPTAPPLLNGEPGPAAAGHD